MPKTQKRLAGPTAVTGTPATAYTAPSATQTKIQLIHVANETGGALPFTASIGTDGADKRLCKDKSIAANDILQLWGPFYLNAADVLQVDSSGTGLTVTIFGEESTA